MIRRFWVIEKHNLKFKLTATITGLVLFISLGLSFVFLVNEFYQYKQQVQREARVVTKSLAEACLPFLITANYLFLQETVNDFRHLEHVRSLWIADEHGRILAHTDLLQVGKQMDMRHLLQPRDQRRGPMVIEDLEQGILNVQMAVQRAGQVWGVVGLEYAAVPLQEKLAFIAEETLLVTLIFVVLGLWLGVVISARISKPLSELTQAAGSLEAGVFEIDMDVDSADEVGILKHRFLKMAEALNLSQKELQEKNQALGQLNRELAWRVEKATNELSQTKDYLTYILASTREGIITTDRLGAVKTMNKAALDILEAMPEAQGACRLWDFYPEMPGLEATFQETLKTGEVGQFQCTLNGKGKQDKVVETALTPLKDDQGVVLGAVVVLNDITQKQRNEAELLRSEKLASVGELAAGIAHEINNSIMVILGFSEVLKRDLKLAGENLDDVQTIEKEAKRSRDIVQQLLNFARPKPLKLQWYDVHAAIESSLHLLDHQIEKKGIRVVKAFDATIPPVFCDASQLELVFTNIMLNATQVLSEGEELHLTTRAESERNIAVSIADAGPGIQPEHLLKVFDPFFTTKPPGEGTGLGLAVAYRVIEAHQGSISVHSKPGAGTVFTIRLPAGQEKREPWETQGGNHVL